MRHLRLILLVLLLGGCATRGALSLNCAGFSEISRSPSPSKLEQAINQAQPSTSLFAGAQSPQLDSVGQRLVDAIRSRPIGFDGSSKPIGVLLLSGGGQWGAYGAGFMNALRQEGKLPDFPVVTGISTGALQALFVGVGDDLAYERMMNRYTPLSESELVDRNAAPLALFTGSFAGLKPLRRTIERDLCEDPASAKTCLLTRLAALRGRRSVLIGFVEAHSGDFRYIDAVEVAATSPREVARSCIAGAALASSAMPVTFQQVRVDNRAYYDGGVRLSVFEAGIASQADLAWQALAPMMKTSPGQPDLPLYVIRNGPTTLLPAEESSSPNKKADAFTAAMRAQSIVVNQLEVTSIASLRLAHPTGPVRFTNANQTGCTKPAKSMFDREFMQCLQRVGAARARSSEPWLRLPPLRTELGAP